MIRVRSTAVCKGSRFLRCVVTGFDGCCFGVSRLRVKVLAGVSKGVCGDGNGLDMLWAVLCILKTKANS